jgi:hypothetical protein
MGAPISDWLTGAEGRIPREVVDHLLQLGHVLPDSHLVGHRVRERLAFAGQKNIPAGWLGFFRDLTARGLSGVALVTSNAHRGLTEAIGTTLPGASWQRSFANPLRRRPHVRDAEGVLAVGEDPAALGL